MKRRISRKGVRFIAKFEGFVDHAYKPVAAEPYWTIGYGHYGPDVKAGATINQRRARKLLREDLRRFDAAVNRLVRVRLNQPQHDALVSFAFNAGESALADSTLLALLNRSQYSAVPGQLLRWVNGASGPLAGLVTRRKAEGALFAHGTY